jgi:alkylation response protein AidB-like acyl-CoA dehydrogenase
LRGDDIWCQGFSEPGAGSDLPSLRTRAIRDGDHYVVTGQKVWTTMATVSNWCFALVRTGDEAARQRGISYLLIDMSLPGIDVRPLRTMAGNEHFAELFFDGVRVPVDCRVGDENDGWRVTRTTLGHERSTMSIGRDARYRSIVRDLVALAADAGKRDDPLMRQRLADLAIGARLVEWSGHRMLQLALQSGEVGPLSSTARLFSTRYEQVLHEAAMDVIGAHAMLAPRELDRHIGRWVNGFLMTRATTIGGGTSEIQRNTIAEQVLGLPRDPGMPER